MSGGFSIRTLFTMEKWLGGYIKTVIVYPLHCEYVFPFFVYFSSMYVSFACALFSRCVYAIFFPIRSVFAATTT